MEKETQRERGHKREWTIQELQILSQWVLSFRMFCSHLRPIIWIVFMGGWESIGCPNHSWDWSSAPMRVQREREAQDALLAMSCRVLHLNSIISAKHLCEGTWDIIIPKHPPNCGNATEITELCCGQTTPCYLKPWYLCINKMKGNSAGLLAYLGRKAVIPW